MFELALVEKRLVLLGGAGASMCRGILAFRRVRDAFRIIILRVLKFQAETSNTSNSIDDF